MDLKLIDHIGIAVEDIEQSLGMYKTLGFKYEGTEVVESQKVKVAFLRCGQNEIELLQPTEQSSTVQKFIDKNGGGIHHIAVRVDNIQKAIDELKNEGVRMIDEKPRYGAGGARIAFIHPKATGVLFEITERQ